MANYTQITRNADGEYIRETKELPTKTFYLVEYATIATYFKVKARDLDEARDNMYDDGDVEILVGTSLPISGDGNAKIIVYNYDGNGLEEDEELTISESAGTSLHGIKIGDIDEDAQPEIIYGSSGGLIRIHDLVVGTQQSDIQSEGSSQHLSKNIGEFGGIDVGDLEGDETPDLVFGSGSYLWIFQAGDEQDRPDLIIEEFSVENEAGGDEITELDDLRVNVKITNTWEGTATATYW